MLTPIGDDSVLGRSDGLSNGPCLLCAGKRNAPNETRMKTCAVRIERRRVDASNAKDVQAAATVAKSTQSTQETEYLLTHPPTRTASR